MGVMKILDTRYLKKRQQELQSEIDDLEGELEDAKEAVSEAVEDGEQHFAGCDCELCEEVERLTSDIDDWNEDCLEELRELDDLEFEIGRGWSEGEAMIHVSYFVEYAQDFARDIGVVNGDEVWPLNCIDWEEAAELLAQDFTVVTYQGEDYYVRSY
jgi:hypothetical protein